MNRRVMAWAVLSSAAAAGWLAYVLPPAKLGSVSEWKYLQSLPSWMELNPLQAHWLNLLLVCGAALVLAISVARVTGGFSRAYLLLPLLIAFHPKAAQLVDQAETVGSACGCILAALALLFTSRWLMQPERSVAWLVSGMVLSAGTLMMGGGLLLCGGLVWQALHAPAAKRKHLIALALASSIPQVLVAFQHGVALDGVIQSMQSLIVTESALAANLMQRRLAIIVPLMLLLGLGWWLRQDVDHRALVGAAVLLLVGCVGAAIDPQDGGAVLAGVCGFALVLAVVVSRLIPSMGSSKKEPQAGLAMRSVALGASMLLAFSGMNTARLNQLELHADRDVLARCRTQVESLSGNPYVPIVDLLIGVPGDESVWNRLYPERSLKCGDHLIDPGEGKLLQISAWVPENRLTAAHKQSYQLRTRLRALCVPNERLMLEGPRDQSVLGCRTATDEPTFAWSVSKKDDPGPGGFTFCWTAQSDGNRAPQLKSKRLHQTTLARGEDHQGRIHYQWRPSIRSEDGAHRELLWEHEEMVKRGQKMVWTILAAKRPRGLLMASPWSLQTEPNEAADLLASK